MKSIRAFFELIKFEHTIFALPFAYLGMLLAARGLPTWHQFIWITVAMAAARTVAMGFNRIADRWWDARNPRTDQRPLITGKISLRSALYLAALRPQSISSTCSRRGPSASPSLRGPVRIDTEEGSG